MVNTLSTILHIVSNLSPQAIKICPLIHLVETFQSTDVYKRQVQKISLNNISVTTVL